MGQIYLAGPFSSEEQIDRASRIGKVSGENKTVISSYSPRHHQEGSYGLSSAGQVQEVYKGDMEEPTNAEFVVAILDFERQTIDPKTVYELGVTTMLKKPMIIVQREMVPTNLIITQNLRTYLKSDQVVREYDSKALLVEIYVGEYSQKRKGRMSVILISGTVSAGKSSLTGMLAKEIDFKPFCENVEDNEVSPLFYSNPEQYAFLLQISFLNKRFLVMRNASVNDDNVLDRSIYGDSLLFHLDTGLGRITDIEAQQHDSLLDTVLNELDDAAPKKQPDLMVHIKVSLDTTLEYIKKHGRDYEQLESDKTLCTYCETSDTRHNQWHEDFDAYPKIQVDGDKLDFVKNLEDARKMIHQIQERLAELEGKLVGKYFINNQRAKGQGLG